MRFEFARESDGSLSAAGAVFQAIGAASMCWSKVPTGVFDDERAKEIGLALLDELEIPDRQESGRWDEQSIDEGARPASMLQAPGFSVD